MNQSRSAKRLNAFEAQRRHLLCVAFRILGSQPDAEDVVQETWLKYERADTSGVRNLPAWLTTAATRLCIDVLRRRRDTPHEECELLKPTDDPKDAPEDTALLASELAAAFTIVLEELTPPQRVALVLHDSFGVPFEEIAHILRCTVLSAKKLASRARERVRRQVRPAPEEDPNARRVVEAFLHAAQEGNADDLLALLDPNVVRIADPHVLPPGAAQRIRGAQGVANDSVRFPAIASRARGAIIDGQAGIIVFTGVHLQLAIVLHIAADRIRQFKVIADSRRLAQLHVRTK
jgi:RNA polymerase sigma-70 factor (ECF subfamily)